MKHETHETGLVDKIEHVTANGHKKHIIADWTLIRYNVEIMK